MEIMQHTILGNSYWNNTGLYQAQFDKLIELMPAQGCADTIHGELVRSVNRLYYEYCNNGNCNARNVIFEDIEDDCPYCSGEGWNSDDEECQECGGVGYFTEEVITDVLVIEFYQVFIDFLNRHLIPSYQEQIEHLTQKIEAIICQDSDSGDYFEEVNMNIYDKVCDFVVDYIQSNEDAPLSNDYLEKYKV